MVAVDNRRMECLTKEEAQRLLNTAQADRNPHIYLFIAIGLGTGMRRSEILSLRLENLHLAQRQVFLPQAKAGARTQPITENLVNLIEQYLRFRPVTSPWLFPSAGSVQSNVGHTTCIEEPFRRVVELAGLDSKRILRLMCYGIRLFQTLLWLVLIFRRFKPSRGIKQRRW